MRSFTDLFIRHPVLAVVVNLAIVLVGWRALASLPVQQYPNVQSSSVVINTVYYGASAEAVRGFLTTPIERAVSAISGIDYLESTSRAGISTVTIHLKLNQNSTAALAEVTARLQQVRSELPAEAEPPQVEVQRADRPYASFYLSFSSKQRDIPAITDWLARTLQPQLATIAGVQRTDIVGGRPIAMRVWIDPDRLAAPNLSPGDVFGALRRNNYVAAVGQTKGNLVQINLLANTDLRSTDEFENLIVTDRGGSVVRLSDVARVELGAEEPDMIAKFNDQEAVYVGVWPTIGSNEIDVSHRLHAEIARIQPTLPPDIQLRVAYDGTIFMQDALVGARELCGPITAMTITLAAVYTPIGFQGGLTGSLFLEFAITLAAAVVVSGIVAVTLSPVMSSRFVHEKGEEGRLTRLVNNGFEVVRRTYARLLDGALEMRPAIVVAAVLVMIAAWPLYTYSKRELAPVEDQSHISLFMQVPPDASLAANNRATLEVVKAVTSFPEAKFMWSLTASWGAFGGMVAKDWKGRQRSPAQLFPAG